MTVHLGGSSVQYNVVRKGVLPKGRSAWQYACVVNAHTQTNRPTLERSGAKGKLVKDCLDGQTQKPDVLSVTVERCNRVLALRLFMTSMSGKGRPER